MADILFVEDEKNIREVLTEYMKVAGYNVLEAENGDLAIDILNKQEVDIAILDIMLPTISGIDVLNHIRNDNRHKNIGIIMLTALDDTNTQVNAFNSMADDYIIKPVSPIILLKRVEALLRRCRNKAEINKEQGIYIDYDSYSAYYNGVKIPLTISEFLILSTMYKNPGRVFTREQLILSVFNDDYAGNDRIIDAHIKNIRKKLPFDCIKTVIGIGYSYDIGV